VRQAYRQLGSRRLCLPWLPWYPEALTTELIRAELRKEGVEAIRFQQKKFYLLSRMVGLTV